MFTSGLLPPPATQTIRFSDCVFSCPEPLTSNTLLGLGGVESPGLYVVLVYDARWQPLPYRPLYFGESDQIWSRATPSHEKYDSWKREGGTATLYMAFHNMSGSTRLQRQARESALIAHYNPPCNEKFSFDFTRLFGGK